MTTTYVTRGPVPVQQTTYITTGPQQISTTYVTTGRQPPPPPPPQATVVVTAPNNRRWATAAQTQSGTAATLLFVYAGMDMAQSLGWNLSPNYVNYFSTLEFQYSWFIGVIIGTVVAAITASFLPKIVFYGLGGVMNLIDAIIFVSAPYQYESILAARYVGGVGIGLITVPFLIHSAEIASSTNRGTCCALEQYGLALGVAIQVIYDSQWTQNLGMTINRVHGIFGIVFAAISLGSLAMTIDSPIFYIRQNQEQKARASVKQLMGAFWTREGGEVAYDEAKLYVVEGSSQGVGEQLKESMMPFLKLLFFRCFVAFTFSMPLSISMEWTTYFVEGSTYSWPTIIFGILRLIGALITFAVLDTVGRKFVSLLGLMCMAGLMLGMAGVYGDYAHVADPYFMWQVCRLGMAFQFFAGLFICSSSVYLGEAFPMRVKPFLIGLIVCLEQVIHIIVIITFATTPEFYYTYFVAVGIIMVIGLVAFAVLMPETRGLTLRQAGERFRRVHDVMAY
ncbi:D-xylose-proton symporter-like 1 [Drosophila rhopaloa]|uniref:D-xylose-proton symporter-like 1 n=2 Tax=Drosophila rhopaloa TaxID=1041015 RepID=A0A6P4FIU2_DRORH|nr:D-xylose-proton symporter-like 1 [Drosophila rhopaloa]